MRLIDADKLKKEFRTNKGAEVLRHSVRNLFALDGVIDAQPTVNAGDYPSMWELKEEYKSSFGIEKFLKESNKVLGAVTSTKDSITTDAIDEEEVLRILRANENIKLKSNNCEFCTNAKRINGMAAAEYINNENILCRLFEGKFSFCPMCGCEII